MKPSIQIYSDIKNNKDVKFIPIHKQIQVTILLKKHYGNKF